MTKIQRLMRLHRLMDEAKGGEQGGAGGGSSDTGNPPANNPPAGGDQGGSGDGNKPSVSDKEAELIKEVMDKKTALKKRDEELAQVREQLKAFEGIDPQKVRELLTKEAEAEAARKKAEEDRLKAEGDFERLKAMMAEEHAKEKQTLEERLKELQSTDSVKDKQIADLTVGNAFGASTYIAEELTLTPTKARVVYGSHFEFKDGKVVGFDKPQGEANRTMLVNSAGDPLPFEDALKRIVEADPERDHVVRSKMKPGANSSTEPKGKVPTQEPVLHGRSRIQAALEKQKAAGK